MDSCRKGCSAEVLPKPKVSRLCLRGSGSGCLSSRMNISAAGGNGFEDLHLKSGY